MAEMVPKVVTGKQVGRWSEAGRRGSLGLFHPNTETRDRTTRALPKLSILQFKSLH